MSQPRSWRSSTSAPSASRSASSGVTRVVRAQLGRAAAHDLRAVGVRADHGERADRARVEREHARRCAAARCSRPRPRARARGAPGGRSSAPARRRSSSSAPMRSNTRQQAQRPCASTQGLVDVARAHRVRQRAARRRGPGPGISRSSPARGEPAVEPSANQSVTTKPSKPHSPRRMPASSASSLGAVAAVEPVVGGHQPERAALADGELERHEVDLAQRALVDHRGHRVALELGLVAGEVLDASWRRPATARRARTPRRRGRRAADPRSSTRSCGPRAASGGG